MVIGYIIGVFFAIWLFTLPRQISQKREEREFQSKMDAKYDSMVDISDSTVPSDIDTIIEFLEKETKNVLSEAKESVPVNAAVAMLGGGKGMFVYRVIKGISGAFEWKGDLAASRISTYISELKEYKTRKESNDFHRDNTGGLVLTLRTLERSIPKLINFRKEEIQSLYNQGILPVDSYERQCYNLANIEGCLAREAEYLQVIVQTYKDIRKRVGDEREEARQGVKAKESASIAYKRGYISASEYQQKVRDIDAQRRS